MTTKGCPVCGCEYGLEIRANQLTTLSLERLASIVESVMDAVITVDDQQRIVLFNKAAETIFRCPRERALGKSLDAFIPERFRAIHREHVHEFGHTGVTRRSMSFPSVLVGLRADGEEFSIEATISQAGGDGEKFFTVVLRDITKRRRAEEERERLLTELQAALAKVKLLSGFLPICATCKKIRNDQGYWEQVETYIGDHSEAEFSHGICPDCLRKLYPEM